MERPNERALLKRCVSQFQADAIESKLDTLSAMLADVEPDEAEAALDAVLSMLPVLLKRRTT